MGRQRLNYHIVISYIIITTQKMQQVLWNVSRCTCHMSLSGIISSSKVHDHKTAMHDDINPVCAEVI